MGSDRLIKRRSYLGWMEIFFSAARFVLISVFRLSHEKRLNTESIRLLYIHFLKAPLALTNTFTLRLERRRFSSVDELLAA